MWLLENSRHGSQVIPVISKRPLLANAPAHHAVDAVQTCHYRPNRATVTSAGAKAIVRKRLGLGPQGMEPMNRKNGSVKRYPVDGFTDQSRTTFGRRPIAR